MTLDDSGIPLKPGHRTQEKSHFLNGHMFSLKSSKAFNTEELSRRLCSLENFYELL